MTEARLPPFESLIKSRDVEDPVNMWLHRPLAYAFVALIYKTSITPNQITGLATVVGFAAAGFWFWGTKTAMILGGILLWTSGIIDGADGILARAKNMSSQFGRVLDGSMDMVVAIVSLAAAFTHIFIRSRSWWILLQAPIAVGMTLPHVYLYDFYKESYSGVG